MAEYFTSIKFEIETSDGWTDISGDVLIDPAPTWNRGIMGGSQLDRVGSPGYLSFSLNNSASNSGGLLGYYSPGHTNVLTGWTTGIPVRLSFGYDSQTFYKYYGRIKPDGIKVHPGQYLDRRVDVTCQDFMGQAQVHELQLMTIQSLKKIEEAVPYVLANMPLNPLLTDYEAGTSTFPTVFDTVKQKTTAAAEFQKLANSELGAIYEIGDATGGSTLRVEGQNTRLAITTPAAISVPVATAGFLLLENSTDDQLLLESSTDDMLILNTTQTAAFTDSELMPGTEINYGKNLTNRVTVTTYPRRIDAAATTVLFTLQDSFEMAGSTSKLNYYGRYRDPSGGASFVNGMSMVVPTTDDFRADTTGGVDSTTDVTLTATYGSDGVSYDLVNSSSDTRVISTLRARGKGIYLYDAVSIIYESSDSIATNGVFPVSVDMKYQDDPTVGELFSSILLARGKDPDTTLDRAVILANKSSLCMYGFLQLEPGRRMTASETVSGLARDFFIQGYEAEITEGRLVWWKPVLQWSGITSTT